jgi:hypothetical protein
MLHVRCRPKVIAQTDPKLATSSGKKDTPAARR